MLSGACVPAHRCCQPSGLARRLTLGGGELRAQERVFSFPSVHFYLPGVGRVSRAVLTASDAESKLRAELGRFLGNGQSQLDLLRDISKQALSPVVRYKDLVSALQGLAQMSALQEAKPNPNMVITSVGCQPETQSLAIHAHAHGRHTRPARTADARALPPQAGLRQAVEGDEQRLAELEELFGWIDADGDGTLRLDELEAAAKALGGSAADTGGSLLERIRAQTEGAPLSVDLATFVNLMTAKAVGDYTAPERELLPAFEQLDLDGDGTISQDELLVTIEKFCSSLCPPRHSHPRRRNRRAGGCTLWK